MQKEISSKRFFSCMAFIAITFLAIALVIVFIANKVGSSGGIFTKIAAIISQIAQALAYVCACVSAYGFVRSKRNVAYTIIYIIACVLIAVFVVLPLII